ncbi:Tigger transposable element-derived protein 1 [Araneus ventricosus]|uniref:Tigger transposable element-derived protein 1 n=1 Tax=Araneus ventricosus TaxID=182803 RepID=A0A4Y2JRX1_ARAVE|nr:Tigger transposable element-derived protein 1 [Araneus ventricosus]
MISLETKIQILDRLKCGEGSSSVAKHFDLNEATVRTIKKNEEKIRACVAAGSPLSMKRTSYARDTTMELMEKALILWVEDNIQKKMPIDGNAIRHKAVNIFNSIKAKQSSSSNKTIEFSGSKGWFEKFKKRFSLNNVKMRGEVASTDEKADKECPKKLHKITEENIYNPGQVFDTDKTDMFGKRMPYMKYLSQTERSAVELNALCNNSSSDCPMKPMLINHSSNGCDAVLTRHNIPILENECYIPTLENEYSEITRLQHQVRGEGLDDTASNELEDSMVDTELNAAELVETVIDSVPYKFETDSHERVSKLTLSIIDKGLALAKELEIFFVENDPNIERSLKFQRELHTCLAPYHEIYKELSKDSRQSLITDFFKKVPAISKQNEVEKNSEYEQISNSRSKYPTKIEKGILLTSEDEIK